jgi:hypothetical protein
MSVVPRRGSPAVTRAVHRSSEGSRRFQDGASATHGVAPLIRVMEQAASSDPALSELRSGLRVTQQADCRHWINQLGSKALWPGLSAAHAVDVMSMMDSRYVYSLLTVDGSLTPDDYEQWLAHALPHLLLKPELLSD